MVIFNFLHHDCRVSNAFSVLPSVFHSSSIFTLSSSYYLFYRFPISIFLSEGGMPFQIFFSSFESVQRPRRYLSSSFPISSDFHDDLPSLRPSPLPQWHLAHFRQMTVSIVYPVVSSSTYRYGPYLYFDGSPQVTARSSICQIKMAGTSNPLYYTARKRSRTLS